MTPEKITHWTAARKIEVIQSVAIGKTTLEHWTKAHGISKDEFNEWCKAFRANGIQGLKTTKLRF